MKGLSFMIGSGFLELFFCVFLVMDFFVFIKVFCCLYLVLYVFIVEFGVEDIDMNFG